MRERETTLERATIEQLTDSLKAKVSKDPIRNPHLGLRREPPLNCPIDPFESCSPTEATWRLIQKLHTHQDSHSFEKIVKELKYAFAKPELLGQEYLRELPFLFETIGQIRERLSTSSRKQ